LRRHQSLPSNQPPVASSGESEETTDSGRGSCEDVTGRAGPPQRRSTPRTSQAVNLPLHQRLPYNGNLTHYCYRPPSERWYCFYARQHICYSAYVLSPIHPSVRHSVCLSVTRVDQSKRLKLGSCNFCHTVASSF